MVLGMDFEFEKKIVQISHTLDLEESMSLFMNKSSFPFPFQFVEPMEMSCVW